MFSRKPRYKSTIDMSEVLYPPRPKFNGLIRALLLVLLVAGTMIAAIVGTNP